MFRNLQLFPLPLFRRPRVNRSVMTALVLALAAMPASAKTITAVMHSDLRVIDPGFTTAYITRDHGYMMPSSKSSLLNCTVN